MVGNRAGNQPPVDLRALAQQFQAEPNSGVVVHQIVNNPDGSVILDVEMPSERAERLKREAGSRLIVELNEVLDPPSF
jgi:hypothetical protein